MELGRVDGGGKPIVFDFSKLELSENLQKLGRGHDLFRYAKASFGNDLQDAVALSNGIDEAGSLDMDMYHAAEAAEVYLEGRQGQPVVLAHHVVDPAGKVVRVDAMVGVLGTSDKLVGVMNKSHWQSGGFSLQGQSYMMSAYAFPEGPLRLERTVPADDTDGVMPFATYHVTLGKPEKENRSDDYTNDQELIAGDDIAEWLERRFADAESRYEIFIGLMKGIRTAAAQDYLLKEPYVTRLKEEKNTLEKVGRTLLHAHTRVSLHEKAITGIFAEATLGLTALAEDTDSSGRRLSYVSSRGNHILSKVDTLRDIDERQQAVRQYQQFLGSLVIDK